MMLTVIIIMIMIMVDHNSDGYGNRCDTWKITEIAWRAKFLFLFPAPDDGPKKFTTVNNVE